MMKLFSLKIRSIGLLALAEISAMSLWFISSAVLPDMLRETALSPFRQAALASGVQVGFVIGALAIAIIGLADRYDPRKVFFCSALLAALANYLLIFVTIGGVVAIILRVLTGLFLAGVYPVGMKIAVGWGKNDRGFLVGLIVGALTIGSATPYLTAYLGVADWRSAIETTSLIGFLGGLLVLGAQLGPYDVRAKKFSVKAIRLAWSNKYIRYAYFGYFGHMWELYAMWAWLSTMLGISFVHHMDLTQAEQVASLVTFMAIALGGGATIAGGFLADKFGKAEITIYAMSLSGLAALATALSFAGPIWLTIIFVVIWGITIIPDSAQFSALVADNAPPDKSGSLLTLQTALGFTLTILTVQGTPHLAAFVGWQVTIAVMALGPLFGIMAMVKFKNLAASAVK